LHCDLENRSRSLVFKLDLCLARINLGMNLGFYIKSKES